MITREDARASRQHTNRAVDQSAWSAPPLGFETRTFVPTSYDVRPQAWYEGAAKADAPSWHWITATFEWTLTDRHSSCAVSVTPLGVRDWYGAAALPEDEVLGPVRRTTTRPTLLLSVFLVVGAVASLSAAAGHHRHRAGSNRTAAAVDRVQAGISGVAGSRSCFA
ncbi:MAG TPA: hypothetical protein VHJ82_00760 [Actinomycetota bacterium]|nr:hypothetical protein [Actinomycetota bacterium]